MPPLTYLSRVKIFYFFPFFNYIIFVDNKIKQFGKEKKNIWIYDSNKLIRSADFEGCGHMQMLRLDQLRFLIKWPLLAHASSIHKSLLICLFLHFMLVDHIS